MPKPISNITLCKHTNQLLRVLEKSQFDNVLNYLAREHFPSSKTKYDCYTKTNLSVWLVYNWFLRVGDGSGTLNSAADRSGMPISHRVGPFLGGTYVILPRLIPSPAYIIQWCEYLVRKFWTVLYCINHWASWISSFTFWTNKNTKEVSDILFHFRRTSDYTKEKKIRNRKYNYNFLFIISNIYIYFEKITYLVLF